MLTNRESRRLGLWMLGVVGILAFCLSVPKSQAATGDWPSNTDGIQFLWESRRAINEVFDEESGSLRSFRGLLHGCARYGPHYEMQLARGWFEPDGVDESLLQACRSSNALSIEATLQPATLEQAGPARIVSFSSSTTSRNFTLGQEGDKLILRLRTPRTGNNGTSPQFTLATLDPDRLQHVLVSYRPGRLRAYLNGREVFESGENWGDFSNWEPQHLLFGDEFGGNRDWAGGLEGVAIYSRFIGEAEAGRNHELYAERLRNRTQPERIRVRARLLESAETPTVERLGTYRRALAEHLYEVEEVLQGQLESEQILVAHWMILDEKRLPERREPGATYRLTLEPWHQHPQLESELIEMYVGGIGLPVFYDVSDPSAGPVSPSPDRPDRERPERGDEPDFGGKVPEDLAWLRGLCGDGALAYQAEGKIYLTELSTGETETVGNGRKPEFSPDGTRLAWIDGHTVKGRLRKGDGQVHTVVRNVAQDAGVHWLGSDAVLVVRLEGERRKGWFKVSLDGERERVRELDRLGLGDRETDVKLCEDGVWSYVAMRHWKTSDGRQGPIDGGCSCSLSPDGRSITALQGNHVECRLKAVRPGGYADMLRWRYEGKFDNHRWSSNDPRFIVCVEETSGYMVVIHRETQRATRMGRSHGNRNEMYGDFTVGDGRASAWLANHPNPPDNNTSNQIRSLTGAHTRLVWAMVEDPDDFCVQGERAYLMGFDTDDGKGVRRILERRWGYSKPILTPDGARVVFSNRQTGKCYRVNWDGSGFRELVDGFASDVWLDPNTGIEWLYVRSDDGKPSGPVLRYRMDDLSVRETVWDRTSTGHRLVPWFRLSADGKRAAGAFPFGQCGVADLETYRWQKHGDGCWPSLAPDNSYRYFHFLGNHRQVFLVEPDGRNSRKITINSMPDHGGGKVYHPRWSHHPRFLTVTAPERSHLAELYLGRFDAGFTRIESWARVTRNDRADYYGDAWIDG